jgi:predicted unusual protein kinase regulating ubiquinone biosynthesis (AarF/ABC1/UbiB family)
MEARSAWPMIAFSAIRRCGRFMGVLRVLVFASRFGFWPSRRSELGTLRQSLEKLGPIWIKLGQWLSLRFDVIPAHVCRELLEMHADAPPMSFEQAREMFKAELGRWPEEALASIEQQPFVSTILHQLHRARSRSGVPLVIKVQRPQIESAAALDLSVMRALARMIDLVGLCRPASARGLMREFARSLTSEIDYGVPARFIRMRQLSSHGDQTEVNVTVDAELSARRVLSTRLIKGELVADILDAIHRKDQARMDRFAARGCDANEVGKRIYWNMMNQVYRDGLFHADLTPASMIVLTGNVIGYVDFGMMGRFSDDMRQSCYFMFVSLSAQQIDAAIDELSRWLIPSAKTDVPRFRAALARALEDYLDSFRGPATETPRQGNANLAIDMMIVARQHRVVIPEDMALHLRALLTTDAIVSALAPGINLPTEAGRFSARAALLDARDGLTPRATYETALEWAEATGRALRELGILQRTGSSIEISLRTLRLRLFEYGLWAVLVIGLAYVAYTGERFRAFSDAIGIGTEWIASALIGAAGVLLAMMWRQSRMLMGIERTTLTRSHVLTGRGRVR